MKCFSSGQRVVIVDAIFQPEMWNGIICTLIEPVGNQWKMKTDCDNICYFEENQIEHIQHP